MARRALLVAAIAGAIGGHAAEVPAASEDECAIWLCLPGGFPAGCEAPYAAFIDRVTAKPPKPPLPAFSSCSADHEDIDYDWGFETRYSCPSGGSLFKGHDAAPYCREKIAQSQGDQPPYVARPTLQEQLVWTDVPALGSEYQRTESITQSQLIAPQGSQADRGQ